MKLILEVRSIVAKKLQLTSCVIEEDALNEYVLNENGVAWGGSEKWRVPMPWHHEQFSKPVYEVSLRFLDYAMNFNDRKVPFVLLFVHSFAFFKRGD
jgi:hypothetical protein